MLDRGCEMQLIYSKEKIKNRFQKISRQKYTSFYCHRKVRNMILKQAHENLYDPEKLYEFEI